MNGFSKAEERLGKIVGDIPHRVIHDLRRIMRTGLSALPVPERVRELMIAQPGLHQVYDQYRYVEEKRRGFRSETRTYAASCSHRLSTT